MNYSKELIKYLKENPFTNIDELIKKGKFVERHISPLAHTFGYEKAIYTLMFVDDKYYGEILQIYDRSLSVDFLVDVSANNNKGILNDFSKAVDDNDHRMYLVKFGGHIVKFVSPIEAKQIMFLKEDTTIRGLLAMNIDIDVYDDDSDGIGIAFCGPCGLTEEGEKEWKDILDYRMDASGLVQVRQKMEERKTIVNSYFGSGRITLFSAHEAFQVARHVLNP